MLPWYNRNGWLGVKHQVTYLLRRDVAVLLIIVEIPILKAKNTIGGAQNPSEAH